MRPNPRAVAVGFLRDLFGRPLQLHQLDDDPDFLKLEARDRRLVTQLVYGVLRQRGYLDYCLQSLSRKPLERMDEVVLWILRLGLYQIHFLRVPDHAAVDQTVRLCRMFRQASAAALVNGVLRAFLRKKPELSAGRDTAALAAAYSQPGWLVRRYLERYGPEQARSLLERHQRPPPLCLWVNPFKIALADFCRRLQVEGISFQLYEELPHCLILEATGFSRHSLYRQGYCSFMDAASQSIAYLSPLAHCRQVGDFCCAPGGKSFLLASQMSAKARLSCCDASFPRLLATRERARHCQVPNLHFVQADFMNPAPFREAFDFVLMDVPCSGLGTLRSNPDIRWKVQERDLERFQRRQRVLLKHGFETLRRGGQLLYATCSTEPEENEEVIEFFLDRRAGAKLEGDYYRTFPGNHPGDCFFAARLRRL